MKLLGWKLCLRDSYHIEENREMMRRLCYILLRLSPPPLIYGQHTNSHLRHTGFMGHFILSLNKVIDVNRRKLEHKRLDEIQVQNGSWDCLKETCGARLSYYNVLRDFKHVYIWLLGGCLLAQVSMHMKKVKIMVSSLNLFC